MSFKVGDRVTVDFKKLESIDPIAAPHLKRILQTERKRSGSGTLQIFDIYKDNLGAHYGLAGWEGSAAVLGLVYVPEVALKKVKTNPMRKFRKERWALSKSEYLDAVELGDGSELSNHDELIAYTNEGGIIVYRNGLASNRFEDGTAGVPKGLQDLAEEIEILYHPRFDEETSSWYDVYVDNFGNFAGFV